MKIENETEAGKIWQKFLCMDTEVNVNSDSKSKLTVIKRDDMIQRDLITLWAFLCETSLITHAGGVTLIMIKMCPFILAFSAFAAQNTSESNSLFELQFVVQSTILTILELPYLPLMLYKNKMAMHIFQLLYFV